VLVYLDGDNNLEDAAIDDVNEMETVGSTASVNVLVQLDRVSGYDSSNGNWTDTRRGRIVQDANTSTISTSFSSIGEVNMGSAASLTSFIQWGVSSYPADHYALILWDHGGGTTGVCWDDTNGDHLTVAEVGQALSAAGVSFDLVGFDACLMGMLEQAYEIRDDADIMVASEQTEPWDGWPYQTLLADLAASPGQSPAAFATAIVTRYGQSYWGAETLSAVGISEVQTLGGELDSFASTVIAEDADWAAIGAARTDASFFTDRDYRDLGSFIDGVVNLAGNANIVAAATAAQTAYASAVIANHSGPSEGATGLSIYFPAQGDTVSPSYSPAQFDLVADTQWDEFLGVFTGSSSGGGADANGSIGDADPAPTFPATINGHVGLDGAQNIGGRDVDIYSLPVTAGQEIGFDIDAQESGGQLDSMLRLFDSDGQELADNDDAHDPDTNISSYDSYIQYTFTKSETVYIGVSGYYNSSYDPWTSGSGTSGSTGAYTLLIRDLGGTVDLDGTISTATDLGSAPVTYSAAIGDETIGDKDVDFYAVEVESNQSLTIALDSGGAGLDAYLKLFTGAGVLLDENDDTSGADPEITYDFSALGAGTYYVAVSGSPNTTYDPFATGSATSGSTGSYDLQISGFSVHLDFDGTIPLARSVGSLPAQMSATIGDEPVGALDVDFYLVDVSAGETIGFDVDADELGYGLDAELRLFDSAGNELELSDDATDPDSGLSGLDPYIEFTFGSTGKYYVAVSGAPNDGYSAFAEASGVSGDTGDYVLRVRSIGSASDANGTLATATPISPSDTVSAEVGDEAAGALDVDMYSFAVSAGQSMTFDIDADENSSDLDSILRLFDGTGTELTVNDDATDPDSGEWSLDSYISYDFTTGGTYYIGVSGYRNDDYNPLSELSGRAGSTGEYELTVALTNWNDLAGVIDSRWLPEWVLAGDFEDGRFDRVAVVVTNSGTIKVEGDVRIDLYASTDQELNRNGDTLLASNLFSMNLLPGISRTYSFTKVDVPELDVDNCYLIADIDTGNAIHELDEENNLAVSDRTVEWREPQRDLTGVLNASRLPEQVVPGDAREGQLTRVPVRVTNNGNVEARGRIVIDLYASTDPQLDTGADTLIAAKVVSVRLPPGESTTVRLSILDVPELLPAEYHLIAHIDSLNAIAEVQDNNNAAASSRTVQWDSSRLDKRFALPVWARDVNRSRLGISPHPLEEVGAERSAADVFSFLESAPTGLLSRAIPAGTWHAGLGAADEEPVLFNFHEVAYRPRDDATPSSRADNEDADPDEQDPVGLAEAVFPELSEERPGGQSRRKGSTDWPLVGTPITCTNTTAVLSWYAACWPSCA